MTGTREEFRVGVFVAIGLVIMGAMVLMLGGDKALFHSYYNIKAYFDNVDGLVEGSIVSVAGVNVGQIEKIRFAQDNQKLQLTLKIDKLYQKRITKGSVAKIKTQGALGDKFIFISPGTSKEAFLKDGDVIPTVEHGDFLGTLSDNSKGVEDVFSIIKEIHLLLQNINGEQRSLNVMKNLSTSAENLNQLITSINEDKKLKRSLTHLANVMEKIDRGHGTLGALVNDPSVFNRMQEILGGTNKKAYLKSAIRKTIESKEAPEENLR